MCPEIKCPLNSFRFEEECYCEEGYEWDYGRTKCTLREPTPTPTKTPTPTEVTDCGKERQEYIASYNKLTDLMSEGKGDTPVAMKAYLDWTEAKGRYERCIECEESGGTWYGGECHCEKAPGFEAVFAIVGLIMSYMLRKRK
jgi:hypothetical protein